MRRVFIILLGGCIVFVCGFATYRGYALWKEERLVSRTQESDARPNVSPSRGSFASQAQAEADYLALNSNPAARCDALRQLTWRSLRETNPEAALSFSRDLIQEKKATFEDRLLHLEILRVSTNGPMGGLLTTLQQESADSPAKVFTLASWMLDAGHVELAHSWINTLPSAVRCSCPVEIAEARCSVAAGKWACLQTNLAAQSWANLEFLRLALLSRSWKEQGNGPAAAAQWKAALKAAGERHESLLHLYHTVEVWNWPQEQEEVLWTIQSRHPGDQWAVAMLTQRLLLTGKTRSLLMLCCQALQNDSNNLALMNNLATTALLLKAWNYKPHELALEAYRRDSTNASFISTYAFSLLVQQKTNEAVQVVKQIPTSQREEPAIAAYYGIILSAAGDAEEAEKYLDMGAKAKLLPEEAELVRAARRNGDLSRRD